MEKYERIEGVIQTLSASTHQEQTSEDDKAPRIVGRIPEELVLLDGHRRATVSPHALEENSIEQQREAVSTVQKCGHNAPHFSSQDKGPKEGDLERRYEPKRTRYRNQSLTDEQRTRYARDLGTVSDNAQCIHDVEVTTMSLHGFRPIRVLDQDARARTINVLGECQIDGGSNAVLLVEKTNFGSAFVERLRDGSAFERLECIGQNDVYTWEFGWLADGDAHTKMTLICPASDDVVAKYSAQDIYMVNETAELYKRITQPWIASLPLSKKQWVYNILDGVSEKNSVLYSDDNPKSGFVVRSR